MYGSKAIGCNLGRGITGCPNAGCGEANATASNPDAGSAKNAGSAGANVSGVDNIDGSSAAHAADSNPGAAVAGSRGIGGGALPLQNHP